MWLERETKHGSKPNEVWAISSSSPRNDMLVVHWADCRTIQRSYQAKPLETNEERTLIACSRCKPPVERIKECLNL